MHKQPPVGDSYNRHITNTSTCAWKIQATDMISGAPQFGNVWFQNPDGTWNENGPFTIQPNTYTAITYTDRNGGDQGSLKITDGANRMQQFDYINGYINHSGGTGGASLNDPTDGDITIGNCTW